MKKAWVERKEKERREKIAALTEQITKGLSESGLYTEDEAILFMKEIDRLINLYCYVSPRQIAPSNYPDLFNKWFSIRKETLSLLEKLPVEELVCLYDKDYWRYLDSEPKHYHGDIIITDPCYVIEGDEWDAFWESEDFDSIVPNTICRSTIYGDWSCTTFNTITKKPIGRFCADAGLVAVFNLADVLRYRPGYNDHIEKEWTTTWIHDFDGEIWFKVLHDARNDDYSVRVIGKGKNIKTGESIEFETRQTGF